jgi:hypothetical protein
VLPTLPSQPLDRLGLHGDIEAFRIELFLELGDEQLFIGLGLEERGFGRVKLGLRHGEFHIRHRVGEGRKAGANDRHREHHEEEQPHRDGGHAIGLEPLLGSVAAFRARVLSSDSELVLAGARVVQGRIGHSYCSRYLRTM